MGQVKNQTDFLDLKLQSICNLLDSNDLSDKAELARAQIRTSPDLYYYYIIIHSFMHIQPTVAKVSMGVGALSLLMATMGAMALTVSCCLRLLCCCWH